MRAQVNRVRHLRKFSRLAPVACFPTLGTGCLFRLRVLIVVHLFLLSCCCCCVVLVCLKIWRLTRFCGHYLTLQLPHFPLGIVKIKSKSCLKFKNSRLKRLSMRWRILKVKWRGTRDECLMKWKPRYRFHSDGQQIYILWHTSLSATNTRMTDCSKTAWNRSYRSNHFAKKQNRGSELAAWNFQCFNVHSVSLKVETFLKMSKLIFKSYYLKEAGNSFQHFSNSCTLMDEYYLC